MNIYVGSLHFKMSEAELKEIFEEYGEVTSAKSLLTNTLGKAKDLVSLRCRMMLKQKKLSRN